jgi:hypothetical protein
MRSFLIASFACAAFLSVPGKAAAQAAPDQYITVSGSTCKSTRPGNPDFVSKAIGSRNESTTGVFVICPLTLAPTPSNGGVVTALFASINSLDGASHDVACTAVIGSLVRSVPPTYSTKTVTVTADPESGVVAWTAADFGGTAGAGISGSAWSTVTCMLPPQTGVVLLYAKYNPNLSGTPQ